MSLHIEGETLYTVSELASMLKVTPQTIRKYIKRGELKAKRIGRPAYIRKADILELLAK